MTQAAILELILKLWNDGFRRHELRSGPRFKSYFLMGLNAPAICWNLFLGDRLTEEDLRESERCFAHDRASIARPYISLPVLGGFAEPALLKDNGYELENTDSYCFTERMIETGDAGRYRAVEGDFEDANVYEDYAKTTSVVYNLKDRAFAEFNRRFNREMHLPNRILNFYEGAEPAGTACLSMIGGTCWLYGDAVREPFREKGLWKTMTRARQENSRSLGAKSWFMQTKLPHLARQFETVLEIRNYRRR